MDRLAGKAFHYLTSFIHILVVWILLGKIDFCPLIASSKKTELSNSIFEASMK